MLDPPTLEAAMKGQDIVNAPGCFTRDEAIDYQVTHKGEPFRGHDVSL